LSHHKIQVIMNPYPFHDMYDSMSFFHPFEALVTLHI
jgi:hypothetical protein